MCFDTSVVGGPGWECDECDTTLDDTPAENPVYKRGYFKGVNGLVQAFVRFLSAPYRGVVTSDPRLNKVFDDIAELHEKAMAAKTASILSSYPIKDAEVVNV